MNTQHIYTLVEKSAKAQDSGDAMRFAQAALNAANALCSTLSVEQHRTKTPDA